MKDFIVINTKQLNNRLLEKHFWDTIIWKIA